jgi:threonine synthase
MKYYSTRDNQKKVTASYAIANGLAPDGGLYVPETLPALKLSDIEELLNLDYRGRALMIMSKFLDEFSVSEIMRFTVGAYDTSFDSDAIAPLTVLDDTTAVLELYHGPTCAFKDMALQMLPYLLTSSLEKTEEKREVCILVATSGDTGKAALEGFKDIPGTKIIVFYPQDGVSDIQKLQMVTQEGKNVYVCAVEGNFDNAQTGVKQIFGDTEFAKILSERGYFLSSANSINWGRLLPQIVYYFSAYCDFVKNGNIKMGDAIDFCVPTGNFGNILAGWYAKKMGLPVRKFICASNENNVLTDFIQTGIYDKNRPFSTTISPSMDILVSSNLERLLYALSDCETVRSYMKLLSETGRYEVSDDVLSAIQADFAAGFCNDEETKNEIARVFGECEYLMDTHTAVAYKVMREYKEKTGSDVPTIVVSTASPYKFAADVLDALVLENKETDTSDPLKALQAATEVEIPKPLTGLDQRTVRFTQCVKPEDMRRVVNDFLKK